MEPEIEYQLVGASLWNKLGPDAARYQPLHDLFARSNIEDVTVRFNNETRQIVYRIKPPHVHEFICECGESNAL